MDKILTKFRISRIRTSSVENMFEFLAVDEVTALKVAKEKFSIGDVSLNDSCEKSYGSSGEIIAVQEMFEIVK